MDERHESGSPDTGGIQGSALGAPDSGRLSRGMSEWVANFISSVLMHVKVIATKFTIPGFR